MAGFLRDLLGDVRIEDLKIPLIAVAVDINSRRGHLFTNLDLSEIELWEFWHGVEAVEPGYSQSQSLIAQFLRDCSIAGRIGRWFSSRQ